MGAQGSDGTREATPVWVAVPAAGSGARMGAGIPKQYLPLAGKPLAEHTLAALLAVAQLRETVVAIAPGDPHWPALAPALRARVRVVDGGATRAASVANALRGFSRRPDPGDWVLVHDMARPCVRPGRIAAMLRELDADPVGGLLALPLADTLKHAAAGRAQCTLARSDKWAAQTPQMFRLGLLRRALAQAGPEVTDEASAVEALGLRPLLVPGELENFKITWPADLDLAGRLLRTRANAP